MSDDPSAAGDPEAGRSDLYARIQDLQDEIDSGPTAAQVDDTVRGAVAAVLPGLVSDAVSSAIAGALPSVARSVAAEVARRQAVPDTEGIEARLAALEDALDGVCDRLEALTRDQASTTIASLEDLRAQLADVRGEPPGGQSVDDRRSDEIDALREDLADALDYVRTTLATELTTRAGETQAAIRALAGSLSAPDPQPLADRLEDLHGRLDRIADGIARSDGELDLTPLQERLDVIQESLPGPNDPSDIVRLQQGLDALARSLPDLDASSAVARVHERLDVLSQRLDDLAGDLSDRRLDDADMEVMHVRFDALQAAVDAAAQGVRTAAAEVLGAEMAAVRADLDAPVSRTVTEVDGLRTVVLDAFARLQQSLDAGLSGLAADVSDQVLDVRTDLATTAGETLSSLAAVRDRPQVDVSGRLDALVADVARLADAPAPVDHGDRLDALSGGLAGVDGRVDDLHGRLTDLDDRLEALRADLLDTLGRGQTGLADRLAAAHEDLRTEVAAGADSQRGGFDAVREAQEATIAQLEQVTGHPLLSGAVDVGGELTALQTRLADVLGTLEQASAAAREDARQASETAARRERDLHDRLGTLQEQLGVAVDGFPAQVEAWRAETAEDRARLADALSGLQDVRQEMVHLVEQVDDRGTAAAVALHDAVRAALEQLRGDGAAVAADVRREAADARAALEEHAGAARQGVVDEIRTAAGNALGDVRAAITAQEQETRAAAGEMAQIAGRVQSAGRLVVAYLAERDAALEEVRDRDTVQLLEDVLSALSRKEREKAAGQTRGILARRRESRQAERWRQHQEGHGAADVAVDEQALLEVLDAPAPGPRPRPAAPVTPGTPSADAETPPAAAPVPAKKAPSRQASAPRPTGTKPAARKPAAKKAPRKAAAKKSPATQAPAKKAPATSAAPATPPAESPEPPSG